MRLRCTLRPLLAVALLVALLVSSLFSPMVEVSHPASVVVDATDHSILPTVHSRTLASSADAASESSGGGSVVSAASTPASLSNSGGWVGLDYRSSCTTFCLPPDPDVAAGNGYVFEVTNTVYRIWTTNGTLVLNASLSNILGTGTDALTAAEVRYDPTTLRWFVSAEDLTHPAIYFAGSLTSDPTAAAKYWNANHFGPPGPTVPAQPLFALDSFNLVWTSNVYSSAGAFIGAQIWVANKSAVLAGGGAA